MSQSYDIPKKQVIHDGIWIAFFMVFSMLFIAENSVKSLFLCGVFLFAWFLGTVLAPILFYSYLSLLHGASTMFLNIIKEKFLKILFPLTHPIKLYHFEQYIFPLKFTSIISFKPITIFLQSTNLFLQLYHFHSPLTTIRYRA